MTYATKSVVKRRIGLELADESKDKELDDALTWADARIDNILARFNQTVSSPTPQIIKESSADLAAYSFYRIPDPDKATIFREDGLEGLHMYLDGIVSKGVFLRTDQDT